VRHPRRPHRYHPFGFAGGYTDPTDLIYLIHRYYDPSTGQFISAT
jgi:RHS repeat-associated protein